MTSISTDALILKLQMELDGDENVLRQMQATHDKAVRIQQQSVESQKMQIEAKYDPEIARELALKKLIELQDKLNLSTRVYKQLKDEIQADFMKATHAGGPLVDFKPQVDAQSAANKLRETQIAEEARVAVIQKAQMEVSKIKDAELSHAQRWGKEWTRINRLAGAGLDPKDVKILAEANTARFKAAIASDANLLKAKQDSLNKQAAAEKAAADKSHRAWADENQRRQDAMRKRFITDPQAAKEAADAQQRKIMLQSTANVEKEFNAARQKAISLMNGYESSTQRDARAMLFLNAALADGTINAKEHAQALENIARRQRMMTSSGANMGFVIGNLATGMEDFVTVLSITGFGMDGFASATRSASNNIGQAVRGIGTASAAMIAPFVSIGTVLIGFAIPAIYRWITNTEDAAKATAKWARELDGLRRSFSALQSLDLMNFDRATKAIDISKIVDPDKVKSGIAETETAINRLKLVIAELNAKSKGTGQHFLDLVNPTELSNEFDKWADLIGRDMGGLAEQRIRAMMKTANDTFAQEMVSLGGEEASANYRKRLNDVFKAFGEMRREMGLVDTGDIYSQESKYLDALNAKLAEVQDELDKAQKDEGTDVLDKEQELISLQKEKIAYENQLKVAIEARALAEGADMMDKAQADNLARRNSLELMQIQSKKNKLLGDENEAERRLFDLALRRKEMMESKLATPDSLARMFNTELEAELVQLEKELAKVDNIKVQTGTAGQAQAFASANKMMLEISPKDEQHRKELIQLIKAIKDHLSGKNLMNVEFT